MTRTEKAAYFHSLGYNCAQAVACSFSDQVKLDEKLIFAAAEGFGLGMGGMQSACGALSGAMLILSLVSSSADPANITKAQTYKRAKHLVSLFQEKSGALLCKELKGIETGVMLTSCPDCITNAVLSLEEELVL